VSGSALCSRRRRGARAAADGRQGHEAGGQDCWYHSELGTNAGRRTVVTTLFVDGDEALEDIARFVGHAKPTTTAGYVKRLGRRPYGVAKRAAAILDDPVGPEGSD
jgi:hypothetical protein